MANNHCRVLIMGKRLDSCYYCGSIDNFGLVFSDVLDCCAICHSCWDAVPSYIYDEQIDMWLRIRKERREKEKY